MNADMQQIAALAIVALAVLGLVFRRRLRGRRKSCADGCAACPTEKLRR
ncbi:MAG: hypothetical protein HZC55_22580 [Verrucomicrobia bacterium]|nr:hypothetical protein [Verrucomicrobiota bacterium]